MCQNVAMTKEGAIEIDAKEVGAQVLQRGRKELATLDSEREADTRLFITKTHLSKGSPWAPG